MENKSVPFYLFYLLLFRCYSSQPTIDATGAPTSSSALYTAIADEDVGAPIHLHTTFTGIPPIRFFNSAGPISCTERPCASTATVAGFSHSVQIFLAASIAVTLVFIIMAFSLLISPVAAFVLSFVMRHGDGGCSGGFVAGAV